MLCCFTMYFRHDFLSQYTAIVSGIENYPSPSMSCCSDVWRMLPCLDLLKSEVQSENKFLPLLYQYKQLHDKRGIAESLHAYTTTARLTAGYITIWSD